MKANQTKGGKEEGGGLAKPVCVKPKQISIYSVHVNLREKYLVRVGLWFTAAGERRRLSS